MENNNNKRVKIVELVYFLGGLIAFFGGGYFIINDYDTRLDTAYKKIDSLQEANLSTTQFYSKKIDSIVVLNKDNSYTLNNKDVSIGDIVRTANEWYKEKEKLKNELVNCKLNLESNASYTSDLKKSFSDATGKYSENLTKAINVARQQEGTLKRYSPSKYQEMEVFIDMLRKYYGINYSVKQISDSSHTVSIVGNAKIDTALSIYEQMRKDKNIQIYEKKKKN